MEVLAGDVGGTHARLALVTIDDGEWSIGVRASYPSPDLAGLAAALERFRDEQTDGRLPERACIGVPCPVREGRCHVTNLDWRIDASEIGERLGLGTLKLINDFDAIGHGLDLLREEDLQTLQEGDADPDAPIALIGAGTGLGEAFVVPGPDAPAVYSSEGGHADFAPADAQQERLLAFLRPRFGHVSWERVVSGPGLANLYDFAVADEHAPESAATRRALDETDDRPRVISRLGQAREDANCEEAIRIFVAAFGAEAGNLALKVGARGGLFVAGGIAPELVGVLADGSFRTAFGAKGRLSEYLAGISVRVVTNTDVGLLGAARVAASARA